MWSRQKREGESGRKQNAGLRRDLTLPSYFVQNTMHPERDIQSGGNHSFSLASEDLGGKSFDELIPAVFLFFLF